MDNAAIKAIALGAFMFIGFLIMVLFKKLKINIKHPLRFSLMLWCIGVGIIYLGYNIYKADVLSPVSNYFYVIGAILVIIGSAVGFYTMFNPPPKSKPFGTSRTEKFVTSITERVLRNLFGNKNHEK